MSCINLSNLILNCPIKAFIIDFQPWNLHIICIESDLLYPEQLKAQFEIEVLRLNSVNFTLLFILILLKLNPDSLVIKWYVDWRHIRGISHACSGGTVGWSLDRTLSRAGAVQALKTRNGYEGCILWRKWRETVHETNRSSAFRDGLERGSHHTNSPSYKAFHTFKDAGWGAGYRRWCCPWRGSLCPVGWRREVWPNKAWSDKAGPARFIILFWGDIWIPLWQWGKRTNRGVVIHRVYVMCIFLVPLNFDCMILDYTPQGDNYVRLYHLKSPLGKIVFALAPPMIKEFHSNGWN